jgi:hypothetical protein
LKRRKRNLKAQLERFITLVANAETRRFQHGFKLNLTRTAIPNVPDSQLDAAPFTVFCSAVLTASTLAVL